MNNWFTAKVKYTKQLENGCFKRVSEPYLVSAMTFTDAEARIYEELASQIRGEFTITDISRADYHEIFSNGESDLWHKCKVSFETNKEDGDGKKKVTHNYLVSADTVEQANEGIKSALQGTLLDYSIPSIVLTQIVDIFPFVEQNEMIDA